MVESTIGEALLLATDHSLLVLGESVREAIYRRTERIYQVRREEIPGKLQVFHLGLQDMLGVGGTRVLERMITKNLCNRLGLSFANRDDWTLVDYVNAMSEERDETRPQGRKPRVIRETNESEVSGSSSEPDLLLSE